MIEWYDLNARHEAMLLWLGVILLSTVAGSGGVRKSVLLLLKLFIKPIILVPVFGLFIIVAALAIVAVSFGNAVGLWVIWPVISVVIWGATSGMGILLNYDKFLQKDGEFRRAAAVVTPATVLVAVTNIAILPIWWEIGLLPVLAMLSVIAVYCTSKVGYKQVSHVVVSLLAAYTIAIVSLAIKNIITEPTTWKALAQAALLPIWLTVGTLPYMRCLVLFERWRFLFRCRRKTVRSTDYGQDWPLIVDSARLCAKHGAVWVEVNRRKYGINGTSKTMLPSWGHSCFDLAEVWKDHPTIDGVKVNIHRLIQDGLALERP